MKSRWQSERREGLAAGAVAGLLLAAAVATLAGCAGGGFSRQPAQPGRTTLGVTEVVLPAQGIGNFLVIEARWEGAGPYRFLVDTGSSVTLVTPALARRHPGRTQAAGGPQVRVAGAEGGVLELPRATLRRIELGAARFEEVDVLLHDCAALSAHLGVKIDGVLGFPLFRETLLTLDYPGSRVVLRPARTAEAPAGVVVPFDDARKTPLIRVRLGERAIAALIDSGSDAGLSLNPVGVEPVFAAGPRVGGTVGTMGGDRPRRVGRLAETLVVGGQEFPRPVVDLTDELSSVGGGVLRHFAVSFDQVRDRAIFQREGSGPIETGAVRSAGVAFSKTPAYWRVAGVVPGSPAEAAGVQPGDLVARINGEPVARWDWRRYERLVAEATELRLTFLNGNAETEKRVGLFELVP